MLLVLLRTCAPQLSESHRCKDVKRDTSKQRVTCSCINYRQAIETVFGVVGDGDGQHSRECGSRLHFRPPHDVEGALLERLHREGGASGDTVIPAAVALEASSAAGRRSSRRVTLTG